MKTREITQTLGIPEDVIDSQMELARKLEQDFILGDVSENTFFQDYQTILDARKVRAINAILDSGGEINDLSSLEKGFVSVTPIWEGDKLAIGKISGDKIDVPFENVFGYSPEQGLLIYTSLNGYSLKGGQGSGNWGHSGLVGVHGGSSPTKSISRFAEPSDFEYGEAVNDGFFARTLSDTIESYGYSGAVRKISFVTSSGKVLSGYPHADVIWSILAHVGAGEKIRRMGEALRLSGCVRLIHPLTTAGGIQISDIGITKAQIRTISRIVKELGADVRDINYEISDRGNKSLAAGTGFQDLLEDFEWLKSKTMKGGKGSGNWGHGGLAGVWGGSSTGQETGGWWTYQDNPSSYFPKGEYYKKEVEGTDWDITPDQIDKLESAFEEASKRNMGMYRFDNIDKPFAGYITPSGKMYCQKTWGESSEPSSHKQMAKIVEKISGVKKINEHVSHEDWLVRKGFARVVFDDKYGDYVIQARLPASPELVSLLKKIVSGASGSATTHVIEFIYPGITRSASRSPKKALWYLNRNDLFERAPEILSFKGGQGSGNWGHQGLSGVWGGSSPTNDVVSIEDSLRKHADNPEKEYQYSKISIEDDFTEFRGFITPSGEIYGVHSSTPNRLLSHWHITDQMQGGVGFISARSIEKKMMELGFIRFHSGPVDRPFGKNKHNWDGVYMSMTFPLADKARDTLKKLLKKLPELPRFEAGIKQNGKELFVGDKKTFDWYLQKNSIEQKAPEILAFKGGQGSGNWGHGGLSGVWGGSSPTLEHSWRDNYSKEFWKWFGDSVVKDETGKPKIMYHQTSRTAEQEIIKEGFDINTVGARGSDPLTPDGFFFKPTPNDIHVGSAEESEIVQIPVYLRMENPLIVPSHRELGYFLGEDEAYSNFYYEATKIDNQIGKEFDKVWDGMRGDSREQQNEKMKILDKILDEGKIRYRRICASARARARQYIKDRGYDGVIIKDDVGSFNRHVMTYIVFDPQQIKSVYNFRPTESPLITKEIAEKGGKGSGNWGHGGLAGMWGGSSPTKNAEIINTPEFKKWFQDSKVVDENGNPRLVYHGTDADFQEFVGNRGITGFHFGTAEQADFRVGGKMPPYYENANIIPAYLSIQNPIELSDHDWDTMENLVSVLSSKKISVPKEMIEVSRKFSELKKPDLFDGREKHASYWEKYLGYREEFREMFRETLTSHGYDGAFYENDIEGAGTSWIALYPEQIKSPFNVGEFNPENPNIMKEISQKGGAGSGNWGHSGLAGVWGGSSPTKGGGMSRLEYIETAKKMPWEMTREEFYNTPIYPEPDEGYRLMFHSTKSNEMLDSIQEKGLLVEHGQSESGGMLWGSDKPWSEQKPLVAFQVPEDDIGDNLSGKPITDWKGQYNIHRDIEPKDILAVYPYNFEFGQRADTLHSWRNRDDGHWERFVEFALEDSLGVPDHVKKEYEEFLSTTTKGGQGSGNWGHSGLAGVWGGSSPKEEISSIMDYSWANNSFYRDSLDWLYGKSMKPSITDKPKKLPDAYIITPDGRMIYGEGNMLPTHTQMFAYLGAVGFEELSDREEAMAKHDIFIAEDEGLENVFLDKGYISVRKIPNYTDSWIIKTSKRPDIRFMKRLARLQEDGFLPNKPQSYDIYFPHGFVMGNDLTNLADVSGLRKLPDARPNFLRLEPIYKEISEKGGAGSGNWGHSGLSGVWGGSSPTTNNEIKEAEHIFEEYAGVIAERGMWDKINDVTVNGAHGFISPSGLAYGSTSGIREIESTHDEIASLVLRIAGEKIKLPHLNSIETLLALGFARFGDKRMQMTLPASKKMRSVVKDWMFSQGDDFVLELRPPTREKVSFLDKRVVSGSLEESLWYLDKNNMEQKAPEILAFKGGQGSGNWGHQGLAGVHGGSSPTVNTGKIPDLPESFMRSLKDPFLGDITKAFHEEMRDQFGDSEKPAIADKLPRNFKGERLIVTPDGRVIYPDTGEPFCATHTQMYAYLAMSGFENLDESQMIRAQKTFNLASMEDPTLEGYFFDKGYLSITFMDIGTGRFRDVFDTRDIVVKSHLGLNIRELKKLRKLTDLGFQECSTKPMGRVTLIFGENGTEKTWLDNFYDLGLVNGIRRHPKYERYEIITKERREEAIFKSQIQEIIGNKLSEWREKGGKGSGNWGHSGLAGVHGGSSPTKSLPDIPLDIFGKHREDGFANYLRTRYGDKMKPTLADRLPRSFKGERCLITPEGKVIYPRPDEKFGASHTQMYAYLGSAGVETLTPKEKNRAIYDLERDVIEDEKLEEIFFEKGYISVTLMDRHYDRETMVGVKTGLEPNREALRKLSKLEDIGLHEVATHPIGRLFVYWKDHSYSEFPMNQLWQVRGFLTRDYINPKPIFKEKAEEDTSFKGYMKAIVIDKLIEWQEKGGQGSGNWGHSGLAGVHGGSSPTKNTKMTDTPEFKKWFGDSKVVDENGEPKVVYHGTNKDFQTFDPEYAHFSDDISPLIFGGTRSQSVLFFSANPRIASFYATTRREENANVIPVYLKMEKPFIADVWEQDVGAVSALINDWYDTAAHDGLILRYRVGGEDHTAYVVWYPEQVKSVFNEGSFDSENPNIMKEVSEKGGEGSGNWGHAGLDGVWGGSSPRKMGTTLHESNKHWAGSKADKVRRAFLKKAELHDETRDIFRKGLSEAQHEMFEQIEQGNSFTDEPFDRFKQAGDLLARSNRDDFLELVETMDVKDRLEAQFEIWSIDKTTGFTDSRDRDWARTHFEDKFNESLQLFLGVVPASVIENTGKQFIETSLRIGYGETCYRPAFDKIIIDPSMPSVIESSYIHEFAHWLENHSKKSKKNGLPTMQTKALEFRKRRCGNNKKYITNFGSNCFIDKFHNVYVGRDYPNTYFTEVVSMGMEYLYSDPVRFAKVDPDYFNFCIDLLIGN